MDETVRLSLLGEPVSLRYLRGSQYDEREATIYPRPLLSCTSPRNLLNHL